MNLESLPEDVLHLIFSLFCFHCQHPGHFPNADTLEDRTNKKTLAYLSRTSKAVCEVAQPLLYHYYATGNLEKEIKLYQGKDCRGCPPPQSDFFPQFLRTVTQRPDLAMKVRTLQVIKSGGYDIQLRNTINQLIEYSNTRRLLPHCRKVEGESGYFGEWLLVLAMVCLPRLQSMLLSRDNCIGHFDDTLGEMPDLQIPSVTTVGLIRGETDYHIAELHHLFCALPNLEKVYACDAGGWSMHNSGIVNTGNGHYYDSEYHGTKTIREIHIEGLSPMNMQDFTEALESLEVLEYYWDHYRLEDFDLNYMLESLKPRLRRLYLAFLPYGDYTYPTRCEYPDIDYAPIQSLSDFERLQDLSVDCRSIYLEKDPDTLERLTDLLPPSIRRLRISFLYRGMQNGLRGLAARAPHDFPELKEVVMGVVEQEDFREDIDRTREAGTLLEAVGIRFVWVVDLVGPDARTMIPGATAGSLLVPVPSVRDGVKGLF